jgi:Ca2+-binding EF-hand superfamily protein
MRTITIYLGAALLAVSSGALAQSGPPVTQSGIGDEGSSESHIDNVGGNTDIRPPRKQDRPRAVARDGIDKTVGRMFDSADANNDGIVTLAEFNANVDARKDQIIAQRFARIDTDHNQQLSIAEFAAWQRSIGSVALSDRLDTPQTGQVAENLPIQYGRNDDVDFMSLVIEPLNATMIVAANADYDTGTTLAELLAYEHGLFDKADLNHDGFITWDEIEAIRKKRNGV